MEAMGFRPGRPSAVAARVRRGGRRGLLALGLATPAASAAAAGAMAGAVSVHVPAGFFNQAGGFESPAFLGFTAASIGIAGAGCYSPITRPGTASTSRGVVAVAFLGGALAAAVVVGRRTQDQPDEPPTDAAGQ